MDRPPPLPADLVQRFVAGAHADLEAVTELLAAEPRVLNAAWDWGGGDWETGLGAAAHMGRRDIAELLLAAGARLDVFAAAMLGQLEVVQAILNANPAQRDAAGPHGIPLLAHAEAGAATAVADWLRQSVAA
jgi:HPt (histidine-containing phosphotransfer) domain-containing protein